MFLEITDVGERALAFHMREALKEAARCSLAEFLMWVDMNHPQLSPHKICQEDWQKVVAEARQIRRNVPQQQAQGVIDERDGAQLIEKAVRDIATMTDGHPYCNVARMIAKVEAAMRQWDATHKEQGDVTMDVYGDA